MLRSPQRHCEIHVQKVVNVKGPTSDDLGKTLKQVLSASRHHTVHGIILVRGIESFAMNLTVFLNI